MAGHYRQPGLPLAGHPDSRFIFHDSDQMLMDSRLHLPPDHLSNSAFWYRPDSSLPLVERQEALHLSHSGMPGIEAVKHRRTRSGCFTCRSRRVKCDEMRPICERCRKGNRECEFPKPPTSSKGGIRSKAGRTQSSAQDDLDSSEGDEAVTNGLETIKDEAEDDLDDDLDDEDLDMKQISSSTPEKVRKPSIPTTTRKQKHRHQTEVMFQRKSKARSPSSDSSTSTLSEAQTPASSVQPSARATPLLRSKWAHLRKDVQKYLDYHQEHITYYHYVLHYDLENFFHTHLVDLALTYEPLLYAVVGFAAYNHALSQPRGKLSHFLGYYSLSLSLLRQSLQAGQPRTEATILTILQLATFEEHLGDWPNLIGHHRAAREMLLEIYTKDNIMETVRSRQILAWYARFDLLAGLMSGKQTTLPREWYAECARWHEEHIDPDDLGIESNFAAFGSEGRLIGLDLAALLFKFPRGQVSREDFVAESDKLAQRMDELRQKIQSLNDNYYAVTEFPAKVPLGPDDIVDPYVPGGLFRDALFPLNFAWVGWYGVETLRIYQTAMMLQQDLPPELERLALEQCRILETIERWPQSPDGSILGFISSIGISSLFLPKDQRHTMWLRKKLATFEKHGFVYPTTFRLKMAEMWHEPDINHWWLPNEEGFTPLLRDIRAFIKERSVAYEESKGDELRDDVRDMKAIFSKMNIDASPKSSPSEDSASGIVTRSP